MNLQVKKEKKEEVKMNVSKVGNQTSSQDPQAVNSRSTFSDDKSLVFKSSMGSRGSAWNIT